jgi:TPR repeat protein
MNPMLFGLVPLLVIVVLLPGCASPAAQSSPVAAQSGAATRQSRIEELFYRGLEARNKGNIVAEYSAFNQLAQMGEVLGMNSAADVLEKHPDQFPNALSRAYALRSEAAAAGDFVAQYLVADNTLKGKGVPKNTAKGLEMLTALLEKNPADPNEQIFLSFAERTLALAHWSGEGVEKNDSKAFGLLHSAAMKGLRAAQFDLGYLWETGLGTEVNITNAYVWYSIAAIEDTTNQSAEARDRLGKLLTAEQLKAAQDKSSDLYAEILRRQKK